jgi:Low affinity iron permease
VRRHRLATQTLAALISSLQGRIAHLHSRQSDPDGLLAERNPAELPGTGPNCTLFPNMIPYRSWLTQIGVSTSHPLAFVVVGPTWIVFDHQSFGWQGASTVATWVLTLFIQRAEHHDTQAIHAELDELLRAEGEADEGLATLDRKEPEEIEKHRDKVIG